MALLVIILGKKGSVGFNSGLMHFQNARIPSPPWEPRSLLLRSSTLEPPRTLKGSPPSCSTLARRMSNYLGYQEAPYTPPEPPHMKASFYGCLGAPPASSSYSGYFSKYALPPAEHATGVPALWISQRVQVEGSGQGAQDLGPVPLSPKPSNLGFRGRALCS